MTTTFGRRKTQVLVVGAGPVGLVAALRLRQQGIDVRVIEQQPEFAAHTFPVVLHPQSVRLLSDLGLDAALHWRGRPVKRLAVYTEHERRAVLDLPPRSGSSLGLLTLPQDVVRQALGNALSAAGVAIEWGTRLAGLEQAERSVTGRLLRQLPDGLQNEHPFEARYVIGADGYESTVRQALGIRLVERGPVTSYAFFDARTARSGGEAQLALSEATSNAVYPLQDGGARFSFQILRALDRAPDGHMLAELLDSRLPWYAGNVDHCTWGGVAEFRSALAERFGVGRTWLCGEAAHLTGPLGVQSLNVGMDEANELALHMVAALRGTEDAAFGDEYGAARHAQWRQLLGIDVVAAPSARSPEWARRHLPRLMPCLPASSTDLEDLLDQLRLTPGSGHPEQLASS